MKHNPIPGLPGGHTLQFVVVGLVVILIVLKVLLRRPPKVRPLEWSGRVTGVVGRLGSGKSYFAIKLVERSLRAGADVATNFSMHLQHDNRCYADCDRMVLETPGRWQQFRGWEHLLSLHGTKDDRGRITRRLVVIVDEVANIAPSMGWRMPIEVRQKLSNLRKDGLDFIWITQHESRCAKALRDLSNEIYVCKRVAKTFYATCYEPENVHKPKLAMFTQKYALDTKIASLYDTLEIIESDYESNSGGGAEVRRQPSRGTAQRRPMGTLRRLPPSA